MNIINIDIDFTNGINKPTGIALITGDYASTKIVFNFDRQDGTKIFEMKNPSGEVRYAGEIINNEVVLTGVDDGHNYSIFNESGLYIYEVSLYNGDSKLTSVKGQLPVKQEQVIIGDEVVEPYLPVFDELIQEINEKITEANNLDLDVTDTSGVVEATLTKKNGTTKTVEIIDRNDYYDKDEVDAIQTTIEGEIPTKVSELDNDLNFIDNTVDDLTNYTKTSDLGAVALSNDYDDLNNKPNLSIYSLITETGNKIDLEINSSTYVLTAKMYDKNNNLLSTSTGIDLPLETMVVGASYDSATKEIILTLKNGQEVSFSVADLVSGLQTEITSDNKLSSDLVDDTGHTHKFVSETEKTNWNNKSDFSGSYNDLTNKPDLTLKEDKSNKVTSLSNTSTDTQYPSAKCVYDSQVSQDTQIEQLQEENTYLNSIIDQLPRVNGTGDTITLDNTIKAKMKSKLSPSEMEQEDTPTPDNPQDIHTTTGDNTLKVEGKNLLQPAFDTQTSAGVTCTYSQNGWILNNSATSSYTYFVIFNKTLQAGIYTINGLAGASNSTFQLVLRKNNTHLDYVTTTKNTFTLTEEALIEIRLYVYSAYGTYNNLLLPYQLEKGSTATTYETYNKTDYPLTLGTLEYSKIGDYEDEFIYNTTDTNLELNKWYLKKAIGKVVLNGANTENWTTGGTSTSGKYRLKNDDISTLVKKPSANNVKIPLYSNYYKDATADNTYLSNVGVSIATNGGIYIYDSNYTTSDVSLYKTWLSTHNTIVYYPLASPTYEKLNETLQSQLDNIYNNMMSKKGQTNISQVNDDLPMVITASALLDLNTLVS